MTPLLMRSHEYSYQIQNEAKVVSNVNKMAEAGTTKNTASSTRDLTIVPNITFGFVESFINDHSKSLGNQQLSKGYKYFSEKYITDITGKNRIVSF